MAAPTLTTGSVITFSSGFIAQPLRVSISGIEREFIDSTHMGTTGARTFVPASLYDPGTIEIGMKFDASTIMPITGAMEAVTVDFPGTINNWSASGALMSFDVTGELEDHYEATATIKLSGLITVA